MLRRFLKFGLVGVVGFLVDAAALIALRQWLGPFGGRSISMLCAVTTTFALNRRFVFGGAQQGPLLRQYFAFLAGNLVGAALNFGTYTLMITLHVTDSALFALAIGSLAGWGANFLLSDKFVFALRTRGERPSTDQP
jgi:putative flippase GtrA